VLCGAYGFILTTQFVFCRILDLQGLCTRDGRVLESIFRRSPLVFVDDFRHACAAEWVADGHCGQALRAKMGEAGRKWAQAACFERADVCWCPSPR
jgi:hypothetical protein